MATVTTTSTGIAEITTYESPAARAGAVLDAPFGEVEFSDSFTIPSKLAADENYVVITCTLPRNYFYRLRYQSVFIIGSSVVDLDDFEGAMRWSSWEGAYEHYNWGLFRDNANLPYFNPAGAFQYTEDSVTDNFGMFYERTNDQMSKILIDASTADSKIMGQLLDTTGNVNASSNMTYRVELDMYTVDQANSYQANRAILTL